MLPPWPSRLRPRRPRTRPQYLPPPLSQVTPAGTAPSPTQATLRDVMSSSWFLVVTSQYSGTRTTQVLGRSTVTSRGTSVRVSACSSSSSPTKSWTASTFLRTRLTPAGTGGASPVTMSLMSLTLVSKRKALSCLIVRIPFCIYEFYDYIFPLEILSPLRVYLKLHVLQISRGSIVPQSRPLTRFQPSGCSMPRSRRT